MISIRRQFVGQTVVYNHVGGHRPNEHNACSTCAVHLVCRHLIGWRCLPTRILAFYRRCDGYRSRYIVCRFDGRCSLDWLPTLRRTGLAHDAITQCRLLPRSTAPVANRSDATAVFDSCCHVARRRARVSHLRCCCLAHWLAIAFISARDRSNLTTMDTFVMRWGFFPCLVCAALIGNAIW